MLRNRAPDFSRILYTFVYPDSQSAAEALGKVSDKRRVTMSPSGQQLMSAGRQLMTRDEKVSENTLTFLAQIRASRMQADDPLVRAAEEDLALGGGQMTKQVL